MTNLGPDSERIDKLNAAIDKLPTNMEEVIVSQTNKLQIPWYINVAAITGAISSLACAMISIITLFKH